MAATYNSRCLICIAISCYACKFTHFACKIKKNGKYNNFQKFLFVLYASDNQINTIEIKIIANY